jgi:hypothetical protein
MTTMPIVRTWPYILGALAELADIAIVVMGTVGFTLAVNGILTSDEKRSQLDSQLGDINSNVKKASAKTKGSNVSIETANEARESLSKITENLKPLQQGLENNNSPIGKQYRNRVNDLINRIETLKSDLYQQIVRNYNSPSNTRSTSNPTYLDTGKPSRGADDAIRAMGARSVKRPVSGAKPQGGNRNTRDTSRGGIDPGILLTPNPNPTTWNPPAPEEAIRLPTLPPLPLNMRRGIVINVPPTPDESSSGSSINIPRQRGRTVRTASVAPTNSQAVGDTAGQPRCPEPDFWSNFL